MFCTNNTFFVIAIASACPGDSVGTLWSVSQAATCLPHAVEDSHSLLLLNMRQGSCDTNFYSLWCDPTENRTRRACRYNSTRSISTRPLTDFYRAFSC